MSHLDPDLKRLFKWAREAPPSDGVGAPFGFAGRVLASRTVGRTPTLLEELQRGAWGLACVALGLIVCGLVIFFSQRTPPLPNEEFSSALSFLASNFPR